MKDKYHSLDEEIIFKELKTTINGIDSNTAIKRLEEFGKNELPKKEKVSLFKLFISQFRDSIIIVMLVAILFSFLIGEAVDGFVILGIILIDVILGTFQEWNANKNVDSLKQMIKTTSFILRDGKEVEVDAENIVPGDIIMLASGSIVPADIRLINANNLTADESSLTGESIAAIKHDNIINDGTKMIHASNMVFAGTSIVTGRGIGVVVGTGLNTEIGKIATEVNKADTRESPLTIRINKFSKQIAILLSVLAIILIILLIIKDYTYQEIFLSVIALIVSSMPEGLPLALTMALTIGSNRMLKKNIIVKKMSAVESLGSCTIIASDKTGTLTVNEQTAKKIILPNGEVRNVSGTGYNDEGVIENINEQIKELLFLGMINNEAFLEKEQNEWVALGDSIDIAFLALSKKGKVKDIKIDKVGMIPYESENKYSAVFFEKENNYYVTCKGSVDTILSFSNEMLVGGERQKLDKKAILKQNVDLAKEGYRIIAIASKMIDNLEEKDYYNESDLPKFVFNGLVAFIDPIRKEAASAIKKVREAGIKVVMITGDHPLTAFSIAKDLKMTSDYNEVASSEELNEYLEKGYQEFDNYIKDKTVFTRVTPIQKLEIVHAYQRMGEFVAVTGDGVNDAPALKVANIGVAMGSGTDVAKEVSTMVIRDDNFNSIVLGVEEGRVSYSNIRKVTYMLISCGIAEVLFFVLSIIFNLPMPLVAIQLLWLNLVTDGFQDLALSLEKKEEHVMREKPRNPKSNLFDFKLIEQVLLAGTFIGVVVFIVWVHLINVLGMEVSVARGYVMVLMVFIQNIHVLNCRSETTSIFKMKWNNKALIFSISLALILQIIIMEVPILSEFMHTSNIPFKDLVILFLISIPVLFIMEVYKKFSQKKEVK